MFQKTLLVLLLLVVGDNTDTESHFCEVPSDLKGMRASVKVSFSEDPMESGRDVHIYKWNDNKRDAGTISTVDKSDKSLPHTPDKTETPEIQESTPARGRKDEAIHPKSKKPGDHLGCCVTPYGVAWGIIFAEVVCFTPSLFIEIRRRIKMSSDDTQATTTTGTRRMSVNAIAGFLSATVNLVISGIAQITIGLYLVHTLWQYEGLLQGEYRAASIISVVVGAIIFFVFFGLFYWVVKNKKIQTALFVVVLAVTFIIVVLTGITAFVLHVGIDDKISKILLEALGSYDSGDMDISLWDTLHREYDCCGVNNPAEWKNLSSLKGAYPVSCCKDETVDGCNYMDEEIKTKGCAKTFINWIRERVVILGALECATALICLIPILILVFRRYNRKKEAGIENDLEVEEHRQALNESNESETLDPGVRIPFTSA